MEYGKELLEYRAKHNLTQSQLGEILGVGTVMIHRYEKGVSKPSEVNRIRFAQKMFDYDYKSKREGGQ